MAKPKDNPKNKKDAIVVRWLQEIEAYEREYSSWIERCKKINKIYKSCHSDDKLTNKSEVNLFWANIQTMKPALYAKLPIPQIDRRFKDYDPVGRVASEVLENCTNFILDCSNAHNTFKMCNLDSLLYARATLWARYDVDFKATEYTETNEDGEEEAIEDFDKEYVELDYVNNEDFGHTLAGTWEEVTAVWRKLYLSKRDIAHRFGQKIADNIVMDSYNQSIYVPSHDKANDKENNKCNRVCVYEIWDKYKKRVIWLTKTYDKVLEIKDDFLNLKDFFPCPRPLYGTITNDSLIPVPDYVIYQDQLRQLNILNTRIEMITKAVKVAGAYDGSVQALKRLLDDNVDNKLIPVDSWAMFAEKGGLKGAMQLLPVAEIASVLQHLYDAFDRQKQISYEITGIADLLRGQSNAQETATAQEIKSNYASMRFQDRRSDMSHFLRNAINIIVEIIAEKFERETLEQMSNVKLFKDEQEKQQLQMQLQQGLPVNEELQEKLANPTWEEVLKFLKDDKLLSFRIDIETDSTIRADEAQEQASRLNMLTTVGGFIQQALPAVQASPQLAPVLGEMLLFTVRSFKTGRGIEANLNQLVDEMRKQASQPQQPQPNPDVIKAQIEQQKIQQDAQAQQAQMQIEQQKLQLEFAKLDIEKAKLAQIPQVKQMELEHNIYMDNVQAQREAQDKAIQAQLDQQTALNEQQQQSLDTLRTAQIDLEKEIQLKSLDIQMDRENQDIELYKIDKQEDTKKQLALLSANTTIEQARQNKIKGLDV